MRVLPVYIVVDVSASLTDAIGAINEELADLVHQIGDDPLTGPLTRLCVISFSDDARVEVPLSPPADLYGQNPRVTARGGTYYGPAFGLTRDTIMNDMVALRSAGDSSFRPLVFFITDGAPSDGNWELELNRLHEAAFHYHPTVIALGFNSADPQVIGNVARKAGNAFVLATTLTSSDAIRSIFAGVRKALVSIVSSSTNGHAGPEIALPEGWIDAGAS